MADCNVLDLLVNVEGKSQVAVASLTSVTSESEDHQVDEGATSSAKVLEDNIASTPVLSEEIVDNTRTLNNFMKDLAVATKSPKTKKGCNKQNCASDNTETLLCSTCSSNVHYECTGLPGYQIYRFVNAARYRKYVCEICSGEIPLNFCVGDKVVGTDVALHVSSEKLNSDWKNVVAEKDDLITQQGKIIMSFQEKIKEKISTSQANIVNIDGGSVSLTKLKEENAELTEQAQTHKDELKRKESMIKNMDKAHKTLIELVHAKDVIIENQKVIIDKAKENEDQVSDLKDARDIIALKEIELADCLEQLKVLQEQSSGNFADEELNSLKERNLELTKIINDQKLLIEKAELAFDTQEKLTVAKCEIIDNLKTIIQLNGNTATSQTQIVAEPTDESSELPGLDESIMHLKNLALHGVILNGLLAWFDIQRRTTANDEWIHQALKHFTDEEVTNAKGLLWDASDENVIGKKINRQGSSRKSSEINDIIAALGCLAEKKTMPLFISTSNMIMQTPAPSVTADKTISDIVHNSIKGLESSID